MTRLQTIAHAPAHAHHIIVYQMCFYPWHGMQSAHYFRMVDDKMVVL